MKETERIADQLERGFDGRVWHGPSLMALLSEVEAKKAATHPLPERHTIWEIALHVNAWRRYVIRTLNGERLDGLPDKVSWLPIPDTSQEAWEGVLEELKSVQGTLVAVISEFDEGRLDEIVPGAPYTFYHMLQGIVQHDLYHAGQIAILKRK